MNQGHLTIRVQNNLPEPIRIENIHVGWQTNTVRWPCNTDAFQW
jgi:hypothetical protein